MNKYQDKIAKTALYFIVLQPFLDIMAFLGLPISEAVRGLALVMGAAYLLLISKYRIYLIILFGYLATHLTVNYFLKESFIAGQEINYLIKTSYFLVMLLLFIEICRRHYDFSLIRKLITINITVISLVMVIAELSDTGQRSYGMLIKQGHTGWFFSGNELSAIMAMGLGMVLLTFLKKGDSYTGVGSFLILAVSGWAMMTIGTKVSYGALLIILLAGIGWLIIESWKKRVYQPKITVLLLLLLAVIVYTPLSAIGHNLNISYPNQTNRSEMIDETAPAPVPVKALNGREEFLQATISQYQQAPIIQKLTGLGYAGNYQEEPKLIEMDFIDLFFSYGMMGFLIIMFPLGYSLYQIVFPLRHELWQEKKQFILWIAIILGLGSAALAGHVLTAPAASIYLAVLLAVLYREKGVRL